MKRHLLCLTGLTLGLAASLAACTEKDSAGPTPDGGPSTAGDTGIAGSTSAGNGGGAGTGGSGSNAGGSAGASGSAGSAGASGSAGAGGSAMSVQVGAPLGKITPNPLVSRGVAAFASEGTASSINDGKYSSSGVGWYVPAASFTSNTAWIAIKVGTGKGYSKLLLSWNAGGNYHYGANGSLGMPPVNAPDSYSIETSADFDGVTATSGTWTVATLQVADPTTHTLGNAPTVAGQSITGNDVRTRAHSFSYPADAQWVRLNVSKLTTGSGGLALDEIDIHDVSSGSQDTWLFFGDSITAFAYDRNTPADQPSFAEVIHAAHPSYFPAMIDAGIGSELSVDGDGRLQKLFDLNPDYHFIALGYGTNDSWGAGKDPAGFTVTMQGLVDKIKASGRVPVLARIPYAPMMPDHEAIPAFNTALDGLTTKNSLSTEADLYTFFFNNPQDLMTDMVHPLPPGRIGMNQVWAAACDSAYSP